MIRQAIAEWARLTWPARAVAVAGGALSLGTLAWCAWLLVAVGAL